MNFDLSPDHRMIRDMTRRFADEVIAPRVAAMEADGEYPYDVLARMAELGMMGIPFPEQYGGSGGDWVGMHLCIEEVSRGDVTLGALLDVTTSVVAEELHRFGHEKQKARWLSALASGREIGAFCLTEPNSGSDAASLRTSAAASDGGYVLNGTKQFITNIGLENATVMLVAARTKTPAGEPIISTFIVPKDAPGCRLGKKYEKMAWKASATHEVIFEDCWIPMENLLGDPGKGFSQHLAVLDTGRISIAAVCVGVAQACLNDSLRYAKDRKQFGRPILDFEGVSFKLADMAAGIELARTMYLKAAWLKDQGRCYSYEASIAKLYSSEMLERVASDAVQIHGGYGYMEEYPVSRYYKQAKLLQIVEGTSEVQRLVIARHLARA
ncbi:MAG: acyl-CoA dehydrogenase family protein [Deltaproteobacteria bacterium]|nr:acyl-CoA dehydrogenase family protein [Deltaproteobacteria bacterium]